MRCSAESSIGPGRSLVRTHHELYEPATEERNRPSPHIARWRHENFGRPLMRSEIRARLGRLSGRGMLLGQTVTQLPDKTQSHGNGSGGRGGAISQLTDGQSWTVHRVENETMMSLGTRYILRSCKTSFAQFRPSGCGQPHRGWTSHRSRVITGAVWKCTSRFMVHSRQLMFGKPSECTPDNWCSERLAHDAIRVRQWVRTDRNYEG